MILIISDYDQTINFRGNVSDIDIKTINNFMDEGNILAISSSRNYESLYKDVSSHCFSYNFLCCNNGNAIFDKEKLLDNNPLNMEELSIINELIPCFPDNTEIYLCDAYGFINPSNPVFIKVYLPSNIEFEDYARLFNVNGIETDYYKNYGLLFSKLRDKKYAAAYLGKLTGVKHEDIYSIGDGDNDFTLLQEFNGYSFPWRSEIIKQIDIPIVGSISEMIRNIERVRK